MHVPILQFFVNLTMICVVSGGRGGRGAAATALGTTRSSTVTGDWLLAF
jgi:hypothetical protein